MGIRRDRKKETIRRILQGAAREFAEIGYEGARMDHIAERAEVNKAMIYYHIGDKAALYARVLEEVFGDTAGRMAAAMARAAAPEDQIRAYIRTISQTLRDNPHTPRIMLREMASGGGKLPPGVVRDFATIVGLFGAAVTQGTRQGLFMKTNPLILHLMVIGGIGYYQASEGLRRKFALMAEANPEVGMGVDTAAGMEADESELIHQVEKIVLNALKAVEAEVGP